MGQDEIIIIIIYTQGKSTKHVGKRLLSNGLIETHRERVVTVNICTQNTHIIWCVCVRETENHHYSKIPFHSTTLDTKKTPRLSLSLLKIGKLRGDYVPILIPQGRHVQNHQSTMGLSAIYPNLNLE